MNILLATDANLERGGITLFMLQWICGIREVDKNGKICVYFRDHVEDKELEKQYLDLGTTIYTGNIPRNVRFGNNDARKKVKADIREIITTDQIDVIHIHSGVFGYNLDLLSEAKRRGVQVRISHSHGAYPERKIDKLIHFFMIPVIKQNATLYAACSRKAGIYLFGKRGVSSGKWRFVPNTIQVNRFRFDNDERIKNRSKLEVKDDELLLGAVGHLNVGKNHAFLIEVLAELRKNGIPVKLIVLGKGEQRENLLKKSRQLGVEKEVILYGPVPNVSKFLSAMDIYLMPSQSEGLGISAVEAQANGLPCLLSDRFPEEVVMTPEVFCLPIDQGIDLWVEKIKELRSCRRERIIGAELVKKAGFDESNTADYVKLLYGMNI